MGAYPLRDQGLIEHTFQFYDMGLFRAPTLRNIRLTAPYMHDGSVADLDAVIDHYAAAGRTLTEGPDAGVGSANPLKSSLVRGFELSPAERAALLAFLDALTDEETLADPRFAAPFADD
jgi:cytochrome c peroxidase